MKTKVWTSAVELASEQKERKHAWAQGMGFQDLCFLLLLCCWFPLQVLEWGFSTLS